MKENEDKVRRPKQSRSIQTKESILKASMELFSTKGYHNTNTKEIAALAGVSTGSFYSYYVDKRAVFIEALNLYYQEFHDHLSLALGEMSPGYGDKYAAISHLIDSMVAAHEVFTQFHIELAVMYHSDSEIKAQMDEQYQLGRQLTEKYLTQWGDELQTTDLEAASVVVFELLTRVVDIIVYEPQLMDPNRIKKELITMVLGYLFGK
ncbi:TetR/AcrR family transcriptional regulator [Paenibacillus caui]|uniref:TetR/AcrR family transcriptional regulator n=1 Tax=Paenibacillus caui TaxID=2873927 RepID=UPI003080C7BC